MSPAAIQTAPVIQQLVDRSDAIKERELDRLFRSDSVTDAARPEVDACCDAIIAALIADPAVRHLESAGSADPDALLQTLFSLD